MPVPIFLANYPFLSGLVSGTIFVCATEMIRCKKNARLEIEIKKAIADDTQKLMVKLEKKYSFCYSEAREKRLTDECRDTVRTYRTCGRILARVTANPFYQNA